MTEIPNEGNQIGQSEAHNDSLVDREIALIKIQNRTADLQHIIMRLPPTFQNRPRLAELISEMKELVGSNEFSDLHDQD